MTRPVRLWVRALQGASDFLHRMTTEPVTCRECGHSGGVRSTRGVTHPLVICEPPTHRYNWRDARGSQQVGEPS